MISGLKIVLYSLYMEIAKEKTIIFFMSVSTWEVKPVYMLG